MDKPLLFQSSDCGFKSRPHYKSLYKIKIMKRFVFLLLMTASLKTALAQSDCTHTVWNDTADSTMRVSFKNTQGINVTVPVVIVCWSDSIVQVVVDSWVLGYPSRRYRLQKGATPTITRTPKLGR